MRFNPHYERKTHEKPLPRDAMREKLAADVAAFLAKGKKIKALPTTPAPYVKN